MSAASSLSMNVEPPDWEHFSGILTRLLHQWNFPESIIAAVSTHHTPATAPNRPKRLAALAYAGNILAYRIGLGYGFPQYAALPEPACLRLIDLTPDGLEEYENEVLHSFQREQERFV